MRCSRRQSALVDEIGLVENDPVGRDNLINGLIVLAVELGVVEVIADMLGIDQRHDAVQADLPGNFVVDEERRRDRVRIRKTARLDQDVVEFLATAHEIPENADEIGANAADATDAPIRHFENFLLGGKHEPGVDVDFTEFVLDHRDPVAMFLGENVVEERGLSRSEKACKDRDRDRR
jgi:hypothetical protein